MVTEKNLQPRKDVKNMPFAVCVYVCGVLMCANDHALLAKCRVKRHVYFPALYNIVFRYKYTRAYV